MPPASSPRRRMLPGSSLRKRVEWKVTNRLIRAGYLLTPLSPEERQAMLTYADESVPLPPGAREYLSGDNPRLLDLCNAYEALDLPVTRHTFWIGDRVDRAVDLSRFRADNLYVWQYRANPQLTPIRYFVFSEYVRSFDERGLLAELGEDGTFGCWTFDFPGREGVSRDLLDSVNELYFLDRELGIFEQPSPRVLDIGAGYGRLAHRMSQAVPGLADYCCVDAVPHSTFLCEYYLRHRALEATRVVPLDRVQSDLETGSFDLAVNIHSFSECPYEAIEWWLALLKRLEVPRLLIVPNDGERMLSVEADGSRRDFEPLIRAAGYRLTANEPTFRDPAVSQVIGYDDHFVLFELDEA